MIRIADEKVEFQYPVDTHIKQILNELSPSAFELSCITSDVNKLVLAIDSKYGKCTALKLFSMVLADNYSVEDLDKADKEINGNE